MRFLPTLFAAALVACAPGSHAPSSEMDLGQLVYGDDDRLDVYQVSDPFLLDLADGTAAVMSRNLLHANNQGGYTIGSSATNDYTTDLADSQGVCANEPFADQITPAFCSAFLVGDDLMVTAGHCISTSSCATSRFVFDFEMEDVDTVRTRVDDNDVYSCASVEGRQLSGDEDWAVIRLDRPVQGHTPMPVRRSGNVSVGTSLVLLGHPSGLPLKIAPNGTVRGTSNPVYFDASVDSYGGNSGSPVVNAQTGEVEGILVRGNADYEWSGSCYVSNECSDANGCPGFEDVTRTTLFDHLIPMLEEPGVCDDGNDTSAESEPLTAGSHEGLEICDDDEDWYSIFVPAGASLSASIQFQHASGDLDLALYDNGSEINISQSTTDGESVAVTASADTTYDLVVYGYQGAANTYDLDVDIQGPAPSISLSTPTAPTAGDLVSWQVDDAPVWSTLHIVLGTPGTTQVPGCSGHSVGIGNPKVLGTVETDAVGSGHLTMQVPAVAAGMTRTVYAVSLDACASSNPLVVTF